MHDVSASRLKQLLFEKGWNKSELARRLQVSAQTVHQWEKGMTRPSGKNLTKLAEVADKPEHWFFQENDGNTISASPVTALDTPDKDPEFAFLTDEEKRLVRIFRKFPSVEANNMLLAFEVRYQKLLELYSEYADPAKRKES